MSANLKTTVIRTVGTVFLIISFLLVPVLAAGDSFTIEKQQDMHLFSEALDLAVSSDGMYTFVLAKNGMITIYSASGELVQSLKAGKGYDSIQYSASGNRLLLSGASEKNVKILTLSMIFDLDYKGSPYKGPADAPVTIAAFDDFQ
jgi:hypothetical protein